MRAESALIKLIMAVWHCTLDVVFGANTLVRFYVFFLSLQSSKDPQFILGVGGKHLSIISCSRRVTEVEAERNWFGKKNLFLCGSPSLSLVTQAFHNYNEAGREGSHRLQVNKRRGLLERAGN